MMRVQSPGPLETFTLTVRNLESLSVGATGMIAAVGCFTLGWEKSMHAPLSSLWLNGCFSGPLAVGFQADERIICANHRFGGLRAT